MIGLLLFTNCSNKKNRSTATELIDNNLTVIDKNYPVIDDTICVSQFADSLFYILLGTTPNKISAIQKIFITNSYIFIHDG
jgi:hypothetical protein